MPIGLIFMRGDDLLQHAYSHRNQREAAAAGIDIDDFTHPKSGSATAAEIQRPCDPPIEAAAAAARMVGVSQQLKFEC